MLKGRSSRKINHNVRNRFFPVFNAICHWNGGLGLRFLPRVVFVDFEVRSNSQASRVEKFDPVFTLFNLIPIKIFRLSKQCISFNNLSVDFSKSLCIRPGRNEYRSLSSNLRESALNDRGASPSNLVGCFQCYIHIWWSYNRLPMKRFKLKQII